MINQEYNSMKSDEYLTGYIYTMLFRDLKDAVNNRQESLYSSIYIPDRWIENRYIYYKNIIESIKKEFARFIDKNYWANSWEIYHANYYHNCFSFRLVKEKPRKKMTIEEIEKLLGCKIEVIENHDKQ